MVSCIPQGRLSSRWEPLYTMETQNSKRRKWKFSGLFHASAWKSQNVTSSTFDWSKQSEAQPKFQWGDIAPAADGRKKVKNMMCIQEGEGNDVGHLGNQQPHCPSLEYQVHKPSLASLVHHRIPSTLLLYLAHGFCENIYCKKSKWVYSAKEKCLYEIISFDQNTSFSLPC